jgi:hypothetical protein
MSDQLVAETSSWQHTTLTTNKYPCPRWESNPRSEIVTLVAKGLIIHQPINTLNKIKLTTNVYVLHFFRAAMPSSGNILQKRNTNPTRFKKKIQNLWAQNHNVVCFLLGNSQASEFYMPTFRNTLFHLHRQVGVEWLGLRNVGVFVREQYWL